MIKACGGGCHANCLYEVNDKLNAELYRSLTLSQMDKGFERPWLILMFSVEKPSAPGESAGNSIGTSVRVGGLLSV